MNVQFKFSFFTKEIQSDIKLPLEYETNIASFMEKIECQPIVNFDDLEPFESLEQLDFEVMKYLPMASPQISSYDPVFNDKVYRPGCNYESTLRQIHGEPDLEKIQIAAHEQMELLKQNKKEMVSGANVAMVRGFLKPLDYSVDLLVRTHPTLREYCPQSSCTEVDPEYHLYPSKRERIQLKDEISLKNAKKDSDINFIKTLTKSVGGAFVNDLSVVTFDLPGNFGIRVIETMPTNIRDVFIEQRSNIDLLYKCDNRPAFIPELLEKPDYNDYLTDEESDEAADFEVKVPELDELINQFEQADEIIGEFNEQITQHAVETKKKGFDVEPRYEIKNNRGEKCKMLDDNVSMQREK